MGMVFCRGCGKEIHESAPSCPHCGAPQGAPSGQANGPFVSYDQVPWYRKNWFAILCFLFFGPGLIGILLTGDVYYEKNGELRTYSQTTKTVLIVLSVLFIIVAVAGS